MRIKFICCDVFARLAYAACATSPHIVDLELLPMLKHNEPKELRALLQERINRVDTDKYDKLVLGYGLCGNSTAGLTSDIEMTLPRMHDCCAMFMGSRERFLEAFGDNLSMRWCTTGYAERGRQEYSCCEQQDNYRTNPEYLKLLEEHGEDNADYVWEMLHPPVETSEACYIEIDGFEYGGAKEGFAHSLEESNIGLRVEKGDIAWFNKMVNGPWDDSEFLTCPPGTQITAVYDMHEVMRAQEAL